MEQMSVFESGTFHCGKYQIYNIVSDNVETFVSVNTGTQVERINPSAVFKIEREIKYDTKKWNDILEIAQLYINKYGNAPEYGPGKEQIFLGYGPRGKSLVQDINIYASKDYYKVIERVVDANALDEIEATDRKCRAKQIIPD